MCKHLQACFFFLEKEVIEVKVPYSLIASSCLHKHLAFSKSLFKQVHYYLNIMITQDSKAKRHGSGDHFTFTFQEKNDLTVIKFNQNLYIINEVTIQYSI